MNVIWRTQDDAEECKQGEGASGLSTKKAKLVTHLMDIICLQVLSSLTGRKDAAHTSEDSQRLMTVAERADQIRAFVDELFRHSDKQIMLLKDYKYLSRYLVLLPTASNSLIYERLSPGSVERIAFAGYGAAWSNNDSYFGRHLMKNTQTHREAIHMKTVCWMDYGTQVQGVKINRSCPIYHVFMYHGCVRGQHDFYDKTDLKIQVCR